MNTRPLIARASRVTLGNADSTAQQRRDAITQLTAWLEQTQRRVLNQRAFVGRVDAARVEASKNASALPSNWQTLYNRAKSAFTDNANQAAELVTRQRAELSRLEGGGAVRSITALQPVTGPGSVISSTTLPGYGPATKITENPPYPHGTPLPVHTAAKPLMVQETAASSSSSSAGAPSATASSAGGSLDSIRSGLDTLPGGWKPWVFGGGTVLLLMLSRRGRSR